jgi:GT2 family glycosyltransferase
VSELIDGLQLGLATKLLKRWNVAMVMDDINRPVDWVSGASMMIRPSVFKSIGGLDENYFLYFEETDFCRRSKLAGFSTWYVPKSRVMHIAGQSTNVTNYSEQPKRLPAYWFASRRRYFAMTYGIFNAMLIDVVALFAQFVGSVKRAALGRDHTSTPYYIRDLLQHTVLRRRNRDFPPSRSPDFSNQAH